MSFEIPAFDQRLGRLLPSVILASRSPGRMQLLQERGCTVHVSPTGSGEEYRPDTPGNVVEALAVRKLDHYLADNPQPMLPVIAADTLIGFEGELIGKSPDRQQARRQLLRLRGRVHQVYSGFALYLPRTRFGSTIIMHGCDSADVRFATFEEPFLEAYLDSGEWEHAAGSYRIQGMGKQLVESVDGDYCTVIGLPIDRIFAILEQLAPDTDGARISTLG